MRPLFASALAFTAAAAVIFSAITSGGAAVTAQGADVSHLTIVKYPAEVVKAVGPNGVTYGDFERDLTAVVDDRICAMISLSGDSNTDSEGNKVLVVGTEDQPWVCREPSGSISFFVQSGYPLRGTLPISPGQTLQLRLSIEPPSDPGPIPPHRRFFVHLRVQADGKLVTGTGIPGNSPSVLIVPSRIQQPLSVADTLPYLYPIEANGRLDLALPAEPQLATYNNTQFRLVEATATIVVQSNQLLRFPEIQLQPGDTTLGAVSGQIGQAPPSLSQPLGGGGVASPNVGDGGLK